MEKSPFLKWYECFCMVISDLSYFHKARMNNVYCIKVSLHSFDVGGTLLNLPDLSLFHHLTAYELSQIIYSVVIDFKMWPVFSSKLRKMGHGVEKNQSHVM